MDFGNNSLSSEARHLQQGLAVANRRFLETAAAMGRNLVLGHLDGTYEERPARELLAEAKGSPWWAEHFGSFD